MASFLQKNNDFPFVIKKRVAEICLFSSILYGCETWYCSSYGNLEILYMGIIKSLLAVRKTSCNDLCLIECDMPTLKAAIRHRQHKYLRKKLIDAHDESPLRFAINLVESANTASYKIIKDTFAASDILKKDKQKLTQDVRENYDSPKRMTYLSLNPLLASPNIYRDETT